jgi:dephospho-CoA kinase
MSFSYAVVLTGSIATGKSTAATFLKELGFEIIDADSVAHEVLNQQHKNIALLFGESLVTDGYVDRKALGGIVFSDKEKRKMLEQLLHPLIYTQIETIATALDQKHQPYLVDIPLFFETNRYPIEKSVVVYTSESAQKKRLMQRDTLSEADAKKRMMTQISIEKKIKKASYVIDNSGTLAQLERECKRVKDEILKDFK